MFFMEKLFIIDESKLTDAEKKKARKFRSVEGKDYYLKLENDDDSKDAIFFGIERIFNLKIKILIGSCRRSLTIAFFDSLNNKKYIKEVIHSNDVDFLFNIYEVAVPPSVRGKGNINCRLYVDEFFLDFDKSFNPLGVLMITEAEKIDDASRFYRIQQPADALKKLGLNVHVISGNDVSRAIACNYDVIFMSRMQLTKTSFKFLLDAKKNNVPLIYEVDDLVFDRNHVYDVGAVRSGVHKDVNSMAISFDRRAQMLGLCDAACVTTTLLKKYIKESLHIPVFKMPNAIRNEKFIKKERKIINNKLNLIYMSGSHTHFKDFDLMRRELFDFVLKNTDFVNLTLLGRLGDVEEFKKLSNVSIVDRLPYEEMMELLKEMDVCLVPLENTIFNNAKSTLKFAECSAVGVVTVASPVMEYRECIDSGVDGYLVQDGKWGDVLYKILTEKESLENIAEKARIKALRQFSVDNLSFQYYGLIEDVIVSKHFEKDYVC